MQHGACSLFLNFCMLVQSEAGQKLQRQAVRRKKLPIIWKLLQLRGRILLIVGLASAIYIKGVEVQGCNIAVTGVEAW